MPVHVVSDLTLHSSKEATRTNLRNENTNTDDNGTQESISTPTDLYNEPQGHTDSEGLVRELLAGQMRARHETRDNDFMSTAASIDRSTSFRHKYSPDTPNSKLNDRKSTTAADDSTTNYEENALYSELRDKLEKVKNSYYDKEASSRARRTASDESEYFDDETHNPASSIKDSDLFDNDDEYDDDEEEDDEFEDDDFDENYYDQMSGIRRRNSRRSTPRFRSKKTRYPKRSYSHEYHIKRALLKNYDITTRPVINDTTTTTLEVGLSLYHILDTVSKHICAGN